MKFIEKLKFKLGGRSVPAIKMEDVDRMGKVGTVHYLGGVKRRANSLLTTWDEKGWEIKAGKGQVNMILENGLNQKAFIVDESGQTVDLYVGTCPYPNREDIIGHAATMDDIADSMDLGKSMKNMIIGILIGIGLGAFIIGPMLQTMMS